MSLSQALNKAGDLVEAGWVQEYSRKVVDGQQCYCAIGAISEATGDRYSESYDAQMLRMGAEKLFREVIGGGAITYWNDAKGRTKQEVVSAFRQAALKADLASNAEVE